MEDISPKNIEIIPMKEKIKTPDFDYEMGEKVGGAAISADAFIRGQGDEVFKMDVNGIYLGNPDHTLAPFWVNMAGQIVASDLTLTGGTLKYGKTSFADTDNAGYWIGADGIHFGQSATSYLKYTIGDSLSLIGSIIDGTSTIGGRISSTLAAAIDVSGHFADDAIDTANGTILGDFSFGVSGAIQIGTYENGVTGDIKISPTGILGRDKTGATTLSLNGETGVAVLNGLVVGTNVGIGTAQDSAGVTTIIGNTVTTGFVNALSVLAGSVAAENITGTYITGKTIRTAVSGARVVLDNSDYIQAYDASYLRVKLDTTSLKFYDSSGNYTGDLYGVSGALGIFSTGTPPAELTLSQGVIDMQQGTWILNMTGNDFAIDAGEDHFISMNAAVSSIDVHSNKIVNLTTPTSNYDAATKKYVDDNAGVSTLSALVINANKNWQGYNITNISSLDVTGDIECDDLILNDGGNTIGGDGIHIEFNGTSNAHLVPASGVINSAQLGTASNYWSGLWYGSGGLNQHSTPLSEKDEIVQLKTFKNKTIIDKKTKEVKLVIDKKIVDKDLTSDNGEAIRLDKVVMTLVGAIQKIDDRLNKLENN